MEYSAVYGEDGKKRLTDPAQAVEINPAAKTMTLPMDWDGTLAVRGCIEDMDGGINSESNLEQAQFFGVYANTKSGEQLHLADFDTEEYAKRYADLIDREYDRQAKRDATHEREPSQDRQQTRVQEQTISARDECIAAMRSVGMVVTGEHPIFDKKPHRIEADGDKKGELSGFYVAHPDGRPSGYCKNNRTGAEKRWSVKGYILDDNQKKPCTNRPRKTSTGVTTHSRPSTTRRRNGCKTRYNASRRRRNPRPI
ncbi:MAG: hypothetical protein LUE17_17405 [Planctomycetaceae bacterium]|nr:hypothetical protein [Planctomycetaceae bacterium]